MTAAGSDNSSGSVAPVPGSAPGSVPGSTSRRDQARSTITKRTVTPSPTPDDPGAVDADGADGGIGDGDGDTAAPKRSLLDRLRGRRMHGKLGTAQAPYPGANVIRVFVSLVLSALCLLTVGGAILLLLLWQQQRASGVLSSQLDRTWDLFDLLRQIERWAAFAVVPVASGWMALAAINARRATGRRRNPIVPIAGLVLGLGGVWVIGDRLVGSADDTLGQAAGFVLQAIFLAIPWLTVERVADAAEARHGPLRITYVIAVAFLAHLQFLGGLSTIDQTAGPDEWGRLGGYMIICALLQVLGSLAANEAMRAVEDGTQHRFDLRNRFGESLLAQAAGR